MDGQNLFRTTQDTMVETRRVGIYVADHLISFMVSERCLRGFRATIHSMSSGETPGRGSTLFTTGAPSPPSLFLNQVLGPVATWVRHSLGKSWWFGNPSLAGEFGMCH